MEFNDILTAISTVGFPIVCCIALFYFNSKVLGDLKDTINQNTLILQRLYDRLGGVSSGEKL